MAVGDVMTVRLVTVAPDASVKDAARKMADANVGAVIVCENERLAGIFTERDLLRLVAGADGARDLGATRVGDVMTKDVLTLAPGDDVLEAAHVMAERRIRHLPVIEGGNICGVIGIRDVMGSLVERVWQAHDGDARETARHLLKGR